MLNKILHTTVSLLQIYDSLRANNIGESVFLDSCGKGKYSYLALFPYCTFKSKGKSIWIDGKVTTLKNSTPFDELKKLIKKYKKKYPQKYNSQFPLLNSGCIGYLGYDLVRFLEKIPAKAEDDLKLPDSYFIFPSILLAAEHVKNKNKKNKQKDLLHIFSPNNDKQAFDFITNIIKAVDKINPNSEIENPTTNANENKKLKKLDYSVIKRYNIKSSLTWPQYKKIALKAREYVHAGDSFQIKISQRLEFEIDEEPWKIYKKLRAINPSPYAAFVDFNDIKLISCSPEHLLKVQRIKTDNKDKKSKNEYLAETRPIGGTYPRGKNTEEDKKIAQKFFNDEKELAEHTMLIDLERNDFGRVCKYGTVKVTEMMKLEKYSHLMHIVTNIQGILDDGNIANKIKNKRDRKDCFDAIKAMFPGGTITGCPKVRTMEIIDELEPVARGPYTGSIGGFNLNGECDFNLIIRTLIVSNGKGYLNVGGGIVADSKPRREYEETIEKGLAIVEAVKNN